MMPRVDEQGQNLPVNPWSLVIDEALEEHRKAIEAIKKEWGVETSPVDEFGRPLHPSVSRR